MKSELEDLPSWNIPEYTDWPEDSEYPSKYNPFNWDYELAINEPVKERINE